MKKVTIIGAGIGGLTTAIALLKQGIEVEIFENTPGFKKAGSGINLAINAMTVFKRLDIYEDILKNGNYLNALSLRTIDFKYLTSSKFKTIEEDLNVKSVAIHRAVLHNILLNNIGSTKIHLDKKLERLEQMDGFVDLYFEDGSHHKAEIVIGADGIHSAVRKSIINDSQLRDAKQICWRGISKSKFESNKEELNEIWGNGNRFGFVPISNDETYWFALINKNKFIKRDVDLLEVFNEYPSVVKGIIKETPKNAIICNDIWDLKPMNKWYKGNVCLLGDAAHATTPNMGQGAVQAIESAMALSICLKEEDNLKNAFERYQNIRMKKANNVTKTSWMVGKMAQSDNKVFRLFRNALLKLTPSFLTEKQSRKLFKLNF